MTGKFFRSTSEPIPVDTDRLLDRIATLEGQLQERDCLFEAIRSGEVDGIVANTPVDILDLFALHSVDQPFQEFLRQIGAGAVTVSETGTMLYGSPGLAAMLGVSEEQIVGRQLQEFLGPEDTIQFVQILDQAKHTRARTELTLRSAEGRDIPVYISLNFLRRGAHATVLFGIVTDLSDQKNHLKEMTEAHARLLCLADDLTRARDVAEQANQAKTRFLRSITHELRTPLNGILGYAQLLRVDSSLAAAHLAKIDAMMEAGAHLLHLISNVLDLSEVEAGHITLQASQIHLATFANRIVDVVRPMADAKQLAVSLAISPDAPHIIIADPMRIRQVLFNLIGNAVKFTDRGSVELRLRLVDNGVLLRMEVVDTGTGVPPGQRHRLFQEFERLSESTSNSVGGAGLGLALSARLAAHMGCHLGHEDNPSGGSIFWLDVPVVVVADAAATSVPDGPKHLQPGTGLADRLRVLVVDDIAMNRDIVSSFLGVAGHTVVCVEGGREAVAAAAAEDFDIVMMDVRMPGMDGLEATRRIRALEAPRGLVPIIALTAQAFSAQMKECYEAGMDEHLAKPLTMGLMLDTVNRVAAVRRAAREREIGVATAVTDAGGPGLADNKPPVINGAVFTATAAVLSPELVASHVLTLIDQSEALLHALRAPGALTETGRVLAVDAHQLAGSAGLFGFERLAAAGRHFERAVEQGRGEAAALANSLGVALETALEEMRRKAAAA